MDQPTMLSKPRWFVGSPSSHGSVAGSDGWKYGGYAGLSAPIVRVPGVFVASEAGVHGTAACDGDSDAAADGDAASLAAADAAADGDAAPPEHAAANTATRARAETPVMVRM